MTSAILTTVLRRWIAAGARVYTAAASRGASSAPLGPVPIDHSTVVVQGAPVIGAAGGQTQ